jgi:hypothetical protein
MSNIKKNPEVPASIFVSPLDNFGRSLYFTEVSLAPETTSNKWSIPGVEMAICRKLCKQVGLNPIKVIPQLAMPTIAANEDLLTFVIAAASVDPAPEYLNSYLTIWAYSYILIDRPTLTYTVKVWFYGACGAPKSNRHLKDIREYLEALFAGQLPPSVDFDLRKLEKGNVVRW